MSSQEYWKNREEEQRKKNIKDEAEYAKEIEKIYANVMDEIQKEIHGFYTRYAKAEGITIAEAKKRVSKMDINAYSRKAKRYVKDKNFSKEANEEMRLYNAAMKINRLEMLKANIGMHLVGGFDELQKYFDQILTEKTLEEFERQAGILGNPVAQIANVHTTFNIVTTLILLPFGNVMARIATQILPDSKKEDDGDYRLKYITRFESNYAIGSSAVALSQVRDEIERMRDMVSKNIAKAYDVLIQYNEKDMEKISERETYIDYLNREISEYIVSLISNEKSTEDSKIINGYYAVIGNLERIGDHAMNLAGYAKDLKEWNLSFSDVALEEIEEMKKQCLTALDIVKNEEGSDMTQVLFEASAAEQKIDDLRDKYFKKQMQRMKKGKCKPQSGIIFTEMLTDFERMGDHVKNIAQQYKQMSE